MELKTNTCPACGLETPIDAESQATRLRCPRCQNRAKDSDLGEPQESNDPSRSWASRQANGNDEFGPPMTFQPIVAQLAGAQRLTPVKPQADNTNGFSAMVMTIAGCGLVTVALTIGLLLTGTGGDDGNPSIAKSGAGSNNKRGKIAHQFPSDRWTVYEAEMTTSHQHQSSTMTAEIAYLPVRAGKGLTAADSANSFPTSSMQLAYETSWTQKSDYRHSRSRALASGELTLDAEGKLVSDSRNRNEVTTPRMAWLAIPLKELGLPNLGDGVSDRWVDDREIFLPAQISGEQTVSFVPPLPKSAWNFSPDLESANVSPKEFRWRQSLENEPPMQLRRRIDYSIENETPLVQKIRQKLELTTVNPVTATLDATVVAKGRLIYNKKIKRIVSSTFAGTVELKMAGAKLSFPIRYELSVSRDGKSEPHSRSGVSPSFANHPAGGVNDTERGAASIYNRRYQRRPGDQFGRYLPSTRSGQSKSSIRNHRDFGRRITGPEHGVERAFEELGLSVDPLEQMRSMFDRPRNSRRPSSMPDFAPNSPFNNHQLPGFPKSGTREQMNDLLKRMRPGTGSPPPGNPFDTPADPFK